MKREFDKATVKDLGHFVGQGQVIPLDAKNQTIAKFPSQVITSKIPCFEKSFKSIIDSSEVGTGSVLVQEASDGLDHPVSYFSRKVIKNQKNYSVVEKETLRA